MGLRIAHLCNAQREHLGVHYQDYPTFRETTQNKAVVISPFFDVRFRGEWERKAGVNSIASKLFSILGISQGWTVTLQTRASVAMHSGSYEPAPFWKRLF